jgi:methionyl-tRNA formyltransferase
VTVSPAGEAAAASPARTIFFGSGPFAVPMLEALLQAPEVSVVGVVTVPPRPAGRGRLLQSSPLAVVAAARNLPILQPASLREPAALEAISGLSPTLGVLADYGRIVPQLILDVPGRGFLNVHPSLLPRHRGAAPIPATILAGDSETGVTIIAMDAGVDTGAIVAAEVFELGGSETAPEVERQAAEVGARLLVRIVPRWLAGELEARPQPEDGVTLTRPLRREDGRLDGTESAAASERRVRAYQPWPGTFLEFDGANGSPDRIGVLAAAVEDAEPGDEPGELVAEGDGIALATSDGRLVLRDVRPAGGKRMTGAAWRRGRRDMAGARVLARTEGVPA